MSEKVTVEQEYVITDDKSHSYRWRLRPSPDFPHTYMLVYEEWDDTTRTYTSKELVPCLTKDLLIAFADSMGLIACDIENKEWEEAEAAELEKMGCCIDPPTNILRS